MYSKGISWIDDCRIPFVDNVSLDSKQNQKTNGDKYGGGKGFHKEPIVMQMYKQEGRFPANILVSDDMLNDGVISKSEGRKIYDNEDTNITNNVYNVGWVRTKSDIKDKGTNSRYYDIDKWFENLIK